MARTEVGDDWEARVMAAWDEFADERLGPDIAKDARRYCPEDTGALKDSIENHLEEHDLIVSATGGAGGRVYAAYLSRARPPRVPPEHGHHRTRGRAARTVPPPGALPAAQRVKRGGDG